MKKSKILFMGLVAALLVSCGPSSTPTSSPSEVPTESPTTAPTPPPTTTPVIKDLTVTTPLIDLMIGETAKINVEETGVKFTSNNTAVVTVDSSGTVTALSKGSTTVTLSKDGYNNYEVAISVEDYTIWNGTYYGQGSILTIDGHDIKIDGEAVQNVQYIENEESVLGYEVQFTVDELEAQFSLTLELRNEWYDDRYNVVLNVNDQKMNLLPSVEEFSGSFTMDGSGSIYNVAYTFGNYFNESVNLFDVGVYFGSMSTFYTNTYYLSSYKTVHEGELVTAADVVDGELDAYMSFIAKDKDGKKVLYDLDYQQDYFFYDSIALTGLFINKDNEEHVATLNENVLTITEDTDTSYSVESSWNETISSQLVTATNTADSSDVRYFVPSPYGFFELNSDLSLKDEYVVPMDTSLVIGYQYESPSFEISFPYEAEFTMFINGTRKTDLTYTVLDHKQFFCIQEGNMEIYINIQSYQILEVRIANLDTVEYAIETSVVRDFFMYDTVSYEDGVENSITWSEDGLISYKGVSTNVDPHLNTLDKTVYLTFEVNDVEYKYEYIANNFYLLTNLEDKTSITFFDKDVYLTLLTAENFTSDGTDNLTIAFDTDDKLTLSSSVENGESYPITSKVATHPDFGVMTVLILESESPEYPEIIVYNETLFAEEKTFVGKSEYEAILGNYVFDGPYGLEGFYVTNGAFYADTLENNTLVKKEYDYNVYKVLFGTELVTALSFIIKDDAGAIITSLILYFTEYGKILAVDTPYVLEEIQTLHGVYVSDANSVMYIKENDIIIDGVTYKITNVESSENNISIDAEDFFDTISLDFNLETSEITITSSSSSSILESTTYSKNDFDLSSLLGEYSVNDSTVKFEEKINPLNNIAVGYQLVIDGIFSYSSYQIVIRDGHLAVKFSTGMDYYYIYNNGTSNVCEYEAGSLPPPPPPPPPPMLHK